MRYLALALAAITLVSCNRDPNYLKQKYLESGNKYFTAGRYNEASIYYRKAINADRKFGEGYYKLALTSLKQNAVQGAVQALRRAVELLKPGTPESDDSMLKLGEIMIVASQADPVKSTQIIKEAQSMADGLVQRNPNSWEGHKLYGDLALFDTGLKYRNGEMVPAKKALSDAVAEYRKALASKPGDYVISMALGRTLMMSGEVPEAENIFKTLTEKEKSNLNAYFELYRIYLQQKRIPEAENLLKTAVRNNPKDSAVRLELARFYYGTNRREELIALLNQMKGDLKQFPDAYLQSGDFFVRVNQIDDAIKQYEEGVQKDSARRNTYLKHEIEAYVRQNKLDLAIAKNNEILKNDPKDPDARGLRATFALDKGDVNQAFGELQAVVTARPNNPVARFNLGRAHFARQEFDEARQEFEKAIELSPNYSPARLALTQVALQRGDNNAAVHNADEILKANPQSVQGLVLKASALEREQKFDEARALLTPVLEKNPKQVDILIELGVLDLNQKKNKEAIALFQRAWEAAPNNIRGLLGESRAYLLDGQAAKSVELIKTESEKYPDRPDLVRELGNAQLSAGDFDTAIASYQRLMPLLKDPRVQSDAWIRIAQAYRYKGDTIHSIDALERSRKGVPDNAVNLTNLAILYEGIGKKDIAKKYYESALKIDPNSAFALNNLAFLIAETNGDLDVALTYAQRAKQRLPNYSEITDTLGLIYIKKNLTDSAIDTFKGLVVQAPQNPVFHYHYAMALNQKGDRESAKKECVAALADRPNKAQETDIRQLMSKLSS